MGGLNSDPFWVDGSVSSAFHEETLSLFEGVATSLEPSAPLSVDHPLPLFNDDYPSPPSTSGGAERVDCVPFNFASSTMSFCVRPVDMYVTSSSYCRYGPQLLTALHSHRIALVMST